MFYQWALDFDGVLNNFTEQVRRVTHAKTGVWLEGEPREWEMDRWFNDHGLVGENRIRATIQETIDSLNSRSLRAAYSDQIMSCVRLIAEDYTLLIITKRYDIGEVNRWLRGRIGRRGWVAVSSANRSKPTVMDCFPYILGLIDDRPEHAQQAWDAGYQGWIMSRPWNQESEFPRVTDIRDPLTMTYEY